ncbi:hypothetical protein GFL38_19730 [Rhizobium leguminosarum bv. viciae]|nr:hypothetical protein [Rhizobium leguminosarum bv. viciae]NKQ74803.1 hypothetical protein [Rhizobium ruizarguesonis]NKQ81838.1 hypothetical protein [Rhizobium ruizarguesonis]
MAASSVVKIWHENGLVQHRWRCFELSNEGRRRRSISSSGKIWRCEHKGSAAGDCGSSRLARPRRRPVSRRRYVFLLDLGLSTLPTSSIVIRQSNRPPPSSRLRQTAH